jgi:glutamate--cysteine ligase
MKAPRPISQIGIEREGIRTFDSGKIATTPHPPEFGDPLSNSKITIDYANAQLELVTDPHSSAEEVTAELSNITEGVVQTLYKKAEILCPSSMPPILPKEISTVEIARFRNKEKEIYREGLTKRYGKLLQTLSGIHVNMSFHDDFFQFLKERENDPSDFETFKNKKYIDSCRNIIRWNWLLVYLFGATPTKDDSYTCNSLHQSEKINVISYRNSGKCGYENGEKLPISWDSLDSLLSGIRRNLCTVCPQYLSYEGSQLNAHYFQSPSEHYSPVRAKAVPRRNETYFDALQEKGVGYLELRSIDVDPFSPEGISKETIEFLEVFLTTAMLTKSPIFQRDEEKESKKNTHDIAFHGRDSSLHLMKNEKKISKNDYAQRIFRKIEDVSVHYFPNAIPVVKQIRKRINGGENLPSVRIIEEEKSFIQFITDQAQKHRRYYNIER